MADRRLTRRLAALLVAFILAAGTLAPSFASSFPCRHAPAPGMGEMHADQGTDASAARHCDTCMKHSTFCAFCAMAGLAVVLPDLVGVVASPSHPVVAAQEAAALGTGLGQARDPYPPRPLRS